jgi:hypothetical protein
VVCRKFRMDEDVFHDNYTDEGEASMARPCSSDRKIKGESFENSVLSPPFICGDLGNK